MTTDENTYHSTSHVPRCSSTWVDATYSYDVLTFQHLMYTDSQKNYIYVYPHRAMLRIILSEISFEKFVVLVAHGSMNGTTSIRSASCVGIVCSCIKFQYDLYIMYTHTNLINTTLACRNRQPAAHWHESWRTHCLSAEMSRKIRSVYRNHTDVDSITGTSTIRWRHHDGDFNAWLPIRTRNAEQYFYWFT